MVEEQAYPRSQYGPSPLVDLRSKPARERLSPSALKAFFNIVDRWKVQDEIARELLGGISNGTLYNLKRNPKKKVLGTDELLRVSYLIGIFKSLNILFSQALADAWMQRPNSNSIFGGQTPLAYVRVGGIPALQTVRRLLDARRGGL
ncbi:MAG: MbcA/ParS/Xre antitoxin family protein [Acidobacteriota bacterium]